ncbi:tubulin-like doman-containing protein [Candidatus Poriferisodalis sp.]|uniref:tubulin-like doman-containing protein n=1 Tax=Candidatus Poriferisodalis sp. TaxID=3101277 RepID=UPI003B015BD1
MYNRFLFVGLGGSGGKTLRFLKHAMATWLASRSPGSSIPSAWQFLHIDTPTQADGQEIDDRVPNLADDEYLGLIPPGMDFESLQTILDGMPPPIIDELRTWRVEPAGVQVQLDQGAGQWRAIGHSVALAYARTIHNSLRAKIQDMTGPEAQAQLVQLSANANPGLFAGSTKAPVMSIIVVGSLAGGAGSGLLTTVCDVLRAMNTPAAERIVALLYTPEVFEAVNVAQTEGVYPNSFAAICEMLNGQWWHGSVKQATGLPEPKTNPLLSKIGLPKPQKRSGPQYPFLVGRRSSGNVDHGTPERVFEIAARAMLSWVTDNTVWNHISGYTLTNWDQTAAKANASAGEVLVNLGKPYEVGPPCISAVGFSRLSVGGHYFGLFAKRRLVREAVRHLTKFHTDSHLATQTGQKLKSQHPDQILNAMSELLLTSVLSVTGLAGTKFENHQIIRQLQPVRRLDDELERSVRSNSGVDGDATVKLKATQWKEQIVAAIDAAKNKYLLDYRNELDTSTMACRGIIQTQILDEIERCIGLYGLRLTAKLSDAIADKLFHDVHTLRTEASRREAWASTVGTEVTQVLVNIKGKIGANDRRLAEAIRQGVYLAQFDGAALLGQRAADLAEQIAKGILRPLANALRAAADDLDQDFRQTNAWPAWDGAAPADSERPPKGDYSLIDPAHYSDIFYELLARDIGLATTTSAQREKIRSDVITGCFFKDGSQLQHHDWRSCVYIQQDWNPELPSLDRALMDGPPSSLSVTIMTRIDALEKRAHHRLRDTGSVWERLINCSLREFVDGGDGNSAVLAAANFANVTQRQSRVMGQLGAAMAGAAPLVSVDQQLLGKVQPAQATNVRPKIYLSEIPFAGSVVQDEVLAALKNWGVDSQVAKEALGNDWSLKDIDITTILDPPISVLVVDSLLRPIVARWAECSTSMERQNFWQYRRAQPLESFVPAPQALIRCMTRGWFTGRLLGQIRFDVEQRMWEIWISKRKAYELFSAGCLSTSSAEGDDDALPLTLEALALSYLEVNRQADPGPLVPYIELRDLGRAAVSSRVDGSLVQELFAYKRLNASLLRYVELGQIDAGTKCRAWLDAESDSVVVSPEWRASHVAEECRKLMRIYDDKFTKLRDDWRNEPALLSDAPQWTGLWQRHMRPALEDIMQAAETRAQA